MKKCILFVIIFLVFGMSFSTAISGNLENREIQTEENHLTDFLKDYDKKLPYDEPLIWWNLWPDFPGRYEPMFDVNDIIDLGQTAWGLSTDDFNDDGFLDFVVSWSPSPWTQSTISIFYNSGKNKFTQDDIYTHTEPDYLYFEDLDSGDYDLDGDIDIMFTYTAITPNGGSYTNGTVNILYNDGNNNFINPAIVASLPKTYGRKRIHPQVACADYDQDGDIDFLVGDNSGLVEFYKNDGTSSFSSYGLYDFNFMSWGLSSADFDNDGDIDFIVTRTVDDMKGYIYLVLNDGTASCFNQSNSVKIADLPPEPSFFAGVILGFGCLQSIDYNDDNKMDFIYSGGDSVFLYMQQDTGVFDYFHIMRLPWRNGFDGGFYPEDLRKGGVAIGDFNDDDLDDMVIGGVQGVVRICYNRLVLVDIVQPDETAVYINGGIVDIGLTRPIMNYRFLKHVISVAIGNLTVVAKGLVPLQKVDFYIGIRKVFTDDSEPFEWNWDSFSFRRCKIKAVGYDLDGNNVGFDDALVWKFF